MDIFWSLYSKLDEDGRKELIEQLMLEPNNSSEIKVVFNQGLPVNPGSKPLESIKKP